VTAREILDRGASKIDQDLKAQPLVQARLMNTMGRVYESLGLYDQALPLLEWALATRRKLLGAPNLDLAESLLDVGAVRWRKGEYDEARRLLSRALAIREKNTPEGPEVASTLNSLGAIAYKEETSPRRAGCGSGRCPSVRRPSAPTTP